MSPRESFPTSPPHPKRKEGIEREKKTERFSGKAENSDAGWVVWFFFSPQDGPLKTLNVFSYLKIKKCFKNMTFCFVCKEKKYVKREKIMLES